MLAVVVGRADVDGLGDEYVHQNTFDSPRPGVDEADSQHDVIWDARDRLRRDVCRDARRADPRQAVQDGQQWRERHNGDRERERQ